MCYDATMDDGKSILISCYLKYIIFQQFKSRMLSNINYDVNDYVVQCTNPMLREWYLTNLMTKNLLKCRFFIKILMLCRGPKRGALNHC
jgi:hypothetical protein